jgi:hypothetical protein
MQHFGAVVTDAPILAAVVEGLLAPAPDTEAVVAAAALAATAASFAAKAALTDDGDGVELTDASIVESAVADEGIEPAVDPPEEAFNMLSTDLLISKPTRETKSHCLCGLVPSRFQSDLTSFGAKSTFLDFLGLCAKPSKSPLL